MLTKPQLRLWNTGISNPLPILKWLLTGRGILTSPGCDHGAFVKTSPEIDQADLQIRFLAARAVSADGMTSFTQFRNTKKHPDGYSFQNVATRAKSKGTVR